MKNNNELKQVTSIHLHENIEMKYKKYNLDNFYNEYRRKYY